MCVKYAAALFLFCCSNAAIVPEELPSLLSVAYSNIPPIKKGTDSRVGFGFSLGNHADFQVLLELGPQTNTNPIGASYASNSKRQVNNDHKNQSRRRGKPTTDSEGGKYLSEWSQSMTKPHKKKPTKQPYYTPLPIPAETQNSADSLQGTVDLRELLLAMMKNAEKGDASTKVDEMVFKQPDPINVSRETLNTLKRLYGEKVEVLPVDPSPSKETNFERLSNFKLSEDTRSDDEKRKITADLSDVSLDDE